MNATHNAALTSTSNATTATVNAIHAIADTIDAATLDAVGQLGKAKARLAASMAGFQQALTATVDDVNALVASFTGALDLHAAAVTITVDVVTPEPLPETTAPQIAHEAHQQPIATPADPVATQHQDAATTQQDASNGVAIETADDDQDAVAAEAREWHDTADTEEYIATAALPGTEEPTPPVVEELTIVGLDDKEPTSTPATDPTDTTPAKKPSRRRGKRS